MSNFIYDITPVLNTKLSKTGDTALDLKVTSAPVADTDVLRKMDLPFKSFVYDKKLDVSIPGTGVKVPLNSLMLEPTLGVYKIGITVIYTLPDNNDYFLLEFLVNGVEERIYKVESKTTQSVEVVSYSEIIENDIVGEYTIEVNAYTSLGANPATVYSSLMYIEYKGELSVAK